MQHKNSIKTSRNTGIEHLLWAKTRVEKENHNAVPICWETEPWNSWLLECSMIQIIQPFNIKSVAVVIHKSIERGFKKIHMLLLLFGTTTPTPMSVYGIVKSTYNDLLDMMVVSPTTASYFYFICIIWTPMMHKIKQLYN